MVYAFLVKLPDNNEERVMIVSALNLDYALAGLHERMELERTGMKYDAKLSLAAKVDDFIKSLSLPTSKTEFVMPQVIPEETKSDMTNEERMDAMAAFLMDNGYVVTKLTK